MGAIFEEVLSSITSTAPRPDGYTMVFSEILDFHQVGLASSYASLPSMLLDGKVLQCIIHNTHSLEERSTEAKLIGNSYKIIAKVILERSKKVSGKLVSRMAAFKGW